MSKRIILSENRDFKGVWIPAELYLNTDLTPIEKFLLVEIDSFSKRGECVATNQHFADFLGISVDRVKHIIPDLVKRGYISSTLIYKENSKYIEKRILRVVSFVPSATDSTTPSATNDTTPSATNDTTPSATNSTDKNTYINNTNIGNTNLKYREYNNSSICNNKYILSINKSSVSRKCEQLNDKSLVDIHNKITLAAVMEKVVSLPPSIAGHEKPLLLFSTFADEYKKNRKHKHKSVRVDKLIEYTEKLTDFVEHIYDPDTDKWIINNQKHFSIFDYEKKDIVDMVRDYFAQDFDDCDYSIHHFMSDSVLSARFFTKENKLASIAL